jgi:hypothetical protein
VSAEVNYGIRFQIVSEVHRFFWLIVQSNLFIATLRNEDILWIKDTSYGPKLLF